MNITEQPDGACDKRMRARLDRSIKWLCNDKLSTAYGKLADVVARKRSAMDPHGL